MRNPKPYGRPQNGKEFGKIYQSGTSLTQTAEQLPTPTFQADLTSSITPEIGSAGSFSRGTGRVYWDSPTTMALLGNDAPACPAYQIDVSSAEGGLGLWSGTKNYLLRSDEPATTWDAIGGEDVIIENGSDSWFNYIGFGSIQGGSGNGISQVTALTAADVTALASFWAQADGSPVTVRITIEGDSGGTPETATQDVTITANEPARYYFYKDFTGSATGSVKVSITLQQDGKIYIGGMMLEDKETSAFTDHWTRIPGPQIKTTAAAVTHDPEVLTYPAANITNVEQFTFSAWVNSDWRLFGSGTPYRDMSPSNQDKYITRIRDAGGNSILELQSATDGNVIKVTVNGANFTDLFERHYGKRWYHYVVTVDYTNDEYSLYRNGELIVTDTTELSAPGAAASFYIGNPTGFRQFNGILNYLKYFGGEVFTAEQVAQLYEEELADHEEETYKHNWPLSPNWHDPYTVALWDFSESSGSIVDEVANITCVVNGSPTYGVTFSGHYANFRGITYGTGKSHRFLSPISSLDWDPATNNITIEMDFQKTSTVGVQYLVCLLGNGSTSDYSAQLYFSNDTTLNLGVKANDGTTAAGSWTLDASLVDGSPHRIRVRFGINTPATLWVDEVLHDTTFDENLAAVVTNRGIRIAEKYDGSGDNFIGTIMRLRITRGASDAAIVLTSSGGPMSLGSE